MISPPAILLLATYRSGRVVLHKHVVELWDDDKAWVGCEHCCPFIQPLHETNLDIGIGALRGHGKYSQEHSKVRSHALC